MYVVSFGQTSIMQKISAAGHDRKSPSAPLSIAGARPSECFSARSKGPLIDHPIDGLCAVLGYLACLPPLDRGRFLRTLNEELIEGLFIRFGKPRRRWLHQSALPVRQQALDI